MTLLRWVRERVCPPAPLSDLLHSLARSTGAVTTRLVRAAGLDGRGLWSGPGRYHIEVHGVAQAGGEQLARQVEISLERLPGVAWARVNATSGRVVVAVVPPEPRIQDLVSTIAALERTDGLVPETEYERPHPPDEGPRTRRALSTIAADALGLGLAAAIRVLPLAPLPSELANLVNVVDLHPRLHELVGRRLRRDRVSSAFPLLDALIQGLAGGWAGAALDGTQRLLQWSEARAQLAVWEQCEPELAGTPDRAAAQAGPAQRPYPRPDGPVERYASRILATGGVVGGLALPFVGFKRASALALATMPKAGRAGREGYAACLGRTLARQGVIAMNRGVLRDLDRIDTLVLDADVLFSTRGALTDLTPMPASDTEQVALRTFELFDPEAPLAVHEVDGWRLGPIERLGPQVQTTAAQELRHHVADGGIVLGLVEGDTLTAVIKVEPEPAPGIEALSEAARQHGIRLLVAGDDNQRYGRADGHVPGGDALCASVRALQSDGSMIILVSRDRRALGVADCGVGVWQPDELPPWGADLLVGSDLTVAALVVQAAGLARTVDRHSLMLARAGTGLGALTALTAAPARLPRSTLNAVNAAAAMALVNGVWRAHRLPGRAAPSPGHAAPWHLMPVETVLHRLDTGPGGLTTDDVPRRRTRDPGASNHSVTLVQAVMEELSNPLTPLLAGGAVLSAAVGSIVDAGLVGGVVGLSALIGAGQRLSTERALAAMLSQSAVTARVLRDGTEQVVAGEDLVPGDLIVIGPGDAVPADCRVVEAVGLETDESSLTGESLPVSKTSQPVVATAVAERRSMIYEGTTVAAGRGIAVVVATGEATETGRGMALARQATPASGVEARLTSLTRTALPIAAGSAISVAGFGLLRGVPLVESAATAANLAVASVPEGLPFLVSAAQLAAARRLADHGALVRNPRTIEALGRVDVLCFDKTGTLTEGRLHLSGVGDGDRYETTDNLDDHLKDVLAAGLRATPYAEQPEQVPQQTDRAILLGARDIGVTTGTGFPGWRQFGALQFQPSRGYHATVGRADDSVTLSVKGAPEQILPRCVRRLTADGEEPLDDAGRRALRDALDHLAGAGHRVLAVAERRLPSDVAAPDQPVDTDVELLTFMGFLAIADGVRDSAAPAVRRIREAGVHTIMITGDHPATAGTIAAHISPHGGEQEVITAAELAGLDDDELGDRLMRTDVVARCTPAHKVRIIKALQKCGRTVAMTGDGANDAPAIRLADVGIALGRHGTPAARAAADLVVTDDRLETIIATLVEGRAMWASVRHALSILVGGNLGEIAFSVLTAAATGRSALNGRQLLLVNLLTDLAPAMAIAVRPPRQDATDSLLAEGPDSSLGAVLTREISLRAASTTLGATTGWTLARCTGLPRRASTIALASLVCTQLGQTVLAGGRNPSVLAATVASVATLAAIIQTPGLSHFFGCTPLGPVGWSIATGSALGATLTNTAFGRVADRLSDPAAGRLSVVRLRSAESQ